RVRDGPDTRVNDGLCRHGSLCAVDHGGFSFSHAAWRRSASDTSPVSTSSVVLPTPASRNESGTTARPRITVSARQIAARAVRPEAKAVPSAYRFGITATLRNSYIRLPLLPGTKASGVPPAARRRNGPGS